jgi:hypothetical protein
LPEFGKGNLDLDQRMNRSRLACVRFDTAACSAAFSRSIVEAIHPFDCAQDHVRKMGRFRRCNGAALAFC